LEPRFSWCISCRLGMSVTACFKYNTDTSRVRLLLSIKSRVMLGCRICSSLKALIIPSGQVVQHLHRNEIPLSFLAQAKHILLD
jgi:hypothetical protein